MRKENKSCGNVRVDGNAVYTENFRTLATELTLQVWEPLARL